MAFNRLWLHSMRTRFSRWIADRILDAPLEPILHPSQTRLRWLATFTFLGHLIFGAIWLLWLPQPYENVAIRCGLSLLSLAYILPAVTRDLSSPRSSWVFGMATWVQLPWFFAWMFFMNDANAVWLASLSAAILVYFHMTDWRIAAVGTLAGLAAGAVLASLTIDHAMDFYLPMEQYVVISFSYFMGWMLGFSSANLRRARLINMLSTMGVMAHELRTPLATVNLMGDVLLGLAQGDLTESKRKKLEELGQRLQNLVRGMNRLIDTQISNAQLQRLPREHTVIHARALVEEVVLQYPYKTSRERECVEISVQQDFDFIGSRQLFSQVLTNLLKNALHSLAATSKVIEAGDLRIDIGVFHGKGRIAVSDEGMGIPQDRLHRIFEPFYSTQSGAGSGLGLTFCRNVVEAAKGRISVHSEPNLGAVFILDLPLRRPAD